MPVDESLARALFTHHDTLFQVSTINALLEGVYEGDTTFGELREYGDFGIGTFNCLDGEMLAVDGEFFQLKAGGLAYPVGDELKTPFAVVTFFDVDKSATLDEALAYEELRRFLDELVPTENIFHAIKIEGVFELVRTRSVPKQHKPYPLLVEVVKNQPTSEFHNVTGTLVGFRYPQYAAGANVPGHHFHFITTDGKAGGHVFDCRSQRVAIEVDYTPEFHMELHSRGDFLDANLAGDREEEINKVEK
jgi:acetolactate decarboxylase